MKILGERSLSSKVIVGLNILFTIISIIDIFVLTLLIKSIFSIINNQDLETNIFNVTLFIMIFTTGIIALFIIIQFIKIFKNLKNNVLFSNKNSKALELICRYCFIISFIYFIISIFVFFTMHNLIDYFVYYLLAFSIMLMIIFAVSGIGLKILNEIYKKAIEYKEENDYTI